MLISWAGHCLWWVIERHFLQMTRFLLTNQMLEKDRYKCNIIVYSVLKWTLIPQQEHLPWAYLHWHFILILFRTRDATYDPKDGSVSIHLRGKSVKLFAPSDLKDKYSLNGQPEHIQTQNGHGPGDQDGGGGKKLKLDWVYGNLILLVINCWLNKRQVWLFSGYHGKDVRNNLHLLPTGETVYFAAAVVVLYNADTHSQRHYLGHTEEIKW